MRALVGDCGGGGEGDCSAQPLTKVASCAQSVSNQSVRFEKSSRGQTVRATYSLCCGAELDMVG